MPLHLPPPQGSPRWYRWYEQELLKRHVDIQRLWTLAPVIPEPVPGVPFFGPTEPTFFSVPSDLPSVSSIASSVSSSKSSSSSSRSSSSSSSSSIVTTPWMPAGGSGVEAGTPTWTNHFVGANDDTYNTCTLTTGQTSKYMHAANFGFSIPSGRTIVGIETRITRKSRDGEVVDVGIYVTKNFSFYTPNGTNNSAGATWGTSETSPIYGSTSDLWGQTFAHTDINSVAFGIFLKVGAGAGDGDIAYVDFVEMRVTHSP